MRYFGVFLLVLALAIASIVAVAGFRGQPSRRSPIEIFPDMDRQAKLRPQTQTEFFGDRLSSRQPVDGTIARARPFEIGGQAIYPWEDASINTGRVPGTTNFVEVNPLPITAQLLARGQERYQIFCSPCHGAEGDGKGITTKLGMGVIASLHDYTTRKVIQQPDGQIFGTITHGKSLMGAYGGQISVEDRWAIVAYVRALQRSRLVTPEELPAELRGKLPNLPPPGAPAAAPAPAK
jgi:mono/diheme cytochrome c family protein